MDRAFSTAGVALFAARMAEARGCRSTFAHIPAVVAVSKKLSETQLKLESRRERRRQLVNSSTNFEGVCVRALLGRAAPDPKRDWAWV